MRRAAMVILAMSPWLCGCAAATHTSLAHTQLQIRQYQTRTYETTDARMVMKAVLNVLQDDGYIVREADADLGFLTATREMDVESQGTAFMSLLLWGSNARWDKNSILEVTVNVSGVEDRTRVRAVFQMKTMNNQGAVSKVKQVDDEMFYREFFAKVDKGIFLEEEKL